MQPTIKRIRLAIVIPVYGNRPTLNTLYERILKGTETLHCELTIQFVNDRSPDDSQLVLESLAAKDARVHVLLLSRNHGSFVAIMAGLNEIRDHDAAVILSADLQDPPEAIPELVAHFLEGKQVVLGIRRSRQDPSISMVFSRVFHWLMRKTVTPDMPQGGFDFCLIGRKVIEVIIQSSEKHSSLVGLILWCGFERGEVFYDRAARPIGRSMWTFKKKLDYAVDSIVSFSSGPLRFFPIWGLASPLLPAYM